MTNNNLISSDSSFTEAQRGVLAAVARVIIGEDPDGVLPAVDDPQIFAIVLERARDFERQVSSGLAALETLATTEDAADMTGEALARHLESRPELRSFYRAMMQIVAQSYYQDSRVLTAHGLAARPPFPQGHDVEQGDWELLDVVRQRPAFYRQPD